MEISLKDLQNTKQKFNESFSDYLNRWRGKLAQMRQRPAESDQLMIAIDGCIPPLARKLNDIGIQNFEELYRFGVQKEGDVTQEKKYFGGRTGNKEGPSTNIQINAIDRPRKFSNLGRPLSKVLDKLVEKGLLRPLPPKAPFPNANLKLF